MTMTGGSDVQIAAQAMQAGASDFVEKPIGRHNLLNSIAHGLELSLTCDSIW
jgi:two-component system CheB/CheR fusion protein